MKIKISTLELINCQACDDSGIYIIQMEPIIIHYKEYCKCDVGRKKEVKNAELVKNALKGIKRDALIYQESIKLQTIKPVWSS